MQWQFRSASAPGSSEGDLDLRSVNLVGTPVLSAVLDGSNQEIPDVYELEFHVGAGAVDVACAETPKNPIEADGISVVADGVTVNWNVLLGVGLVIDPAVEEGDRTRISISAYQTDLGAVTDHLNVGTVEAGEESPLRKIYAVNLDVDDASETELAALPGLYFTPWNARDAVQEITNHSSSSREKLAVTATKTITFDNWNAGAKTADVYVGGQLCIATAKLDGETLYEWGKGNGYVDASDLLKGLGIVFRDTTDDPTGLTITLVIDGDSHEWVELAPDVSGAPGARSNENLVLTEDGQSEGVVRSGQSSPFWFDLAVPAGSPRGAIRLFTLRARGKAI